MSLERIQVISLWLLRLLILILLIVSGCLNGWDLVIHLRQGLYVAAATNFVFVGVTLMALSIWFQVIWFRKLYLWLLQLFILLVLVINGWGFLTHLQESLYVAMTLNIFGVAVTLAAFILSFRLLKPGS